jgi:beta-N-acetylhexosaminidase
VPTDVTGVQVGGEGSTPGPRRGDRPASSGARSRPPRRTAIVLADTRGNPLLPTNDLAGRLHNGTVLPVRSRVRLAAATAALMTLSACAGTSAPDPDRATLAGEALVEEEAPRAWAVGPAEGGEHANEPLEVRTGWGPTADEVERAHALVGDLTLRQRAGQVIYARYAGTSAPSSLVNRLHLGGVVSFSDNVGSAGQVRSANRALQRSARAAGRSFPVGVAVDQEGGLVERFTAGTRFPAFMTAGAAGRPELTRAAAAASAAELAGLGFTTDYAPVADVTVGRADVAIGSRSPGAAPRAVATHAVAAARGYWSRGVVPTLKHFPGHGALTTDSHLALPVQRRSVAALEETDYVPFRAGIRAGLPSIMVGHIDVRAVDPGTPASLSRAVITGHLRGRLGFEGLVVTDALDMQAVSGRFSSGQAAVRALAAGADVVLMPPSPRAARDGIVRAVRSGRLSSERLVQAAARQVALLLHQRAVGPDGRPPGSGRAVSARWSAAALTSVAGPCRGRLVARRVVVRGDASDVRRFRAAAAAVGLGVAPPRTPRARTSAGPRLAATTVRLIGSGGAPARADVVVALDRPYVLGDSAAAIRLATFGSTPGAMRGLVRHLLGRADAPGRLPVPVAGVERRGC